MEKVLEEPILEQLLERAIHLASSFHTGQEDKTGHIYILHPLRVMMNVDSIEAKIVAVLHDTIEDTGLTIEMLTTLGYPKEITDTLEILTRDKSIPYFDYIDRIKTSELATKVKLADLKDNMRDGCPDKLRERYEKAYKILTN